MVDRDGEARPPGAGARRLELERPGGPAEAPRGGRRLRGDAAGDAHDDRLAALVLEVLRHGEAHAAVLPETAEDAVVVGEAVNRDRPVDRAFPRPADERGGRRADADDRPDRARQLLDVDARVCELGGHSASFTGSRRDR